LSAVYRAGNNDRLAGHFGEHVQYGAPTPSAIIPSRSSRFVRRAVASLSSKTPVFTTQFRLLQNRTRGGRFVVMWRWKRFTIGRWPVQPMGKNATVSGAK